MPFLATFLPGYGAVTVASLVAAGDVDIGGTSTAHGGHVGAYSQLVPDNPQDTSSFTTVAGRCYAFYVGPAPKDLTSIYVSAYVATAAVAGAGGAALNWAEIGIATGTLETEAAGAETDLTIRGYASIDTEARAGATSFAEKQITGLSILAGTGLWVVMAESYETTQGVVRSFDGVAGGGACRFRAACQPSLSLNAALAFTDSAYTVATPRMTRRIV